MLLRVVGSALAGPTCVCSSLWGCRTGSAGWRAVREWVRCHDLTGHTLDLTVDDEASSRQHIILGGRGAWGSAWRQTDVTQISNLDCFANGYFGRVDWKANRKFAASCAEGRTICTGASFSPAASVGRAHVSRGCFGVVMRSWARGSMWLGLVLTDRLISPFPRVQVSSCRLASAG